MNIKKATTAAYTRLFGSSGTSVSDMQSRANVDYVIRETGATKEQAKAIIAEGLASNPAFKHTLPENRAALLAAIVDNFYKGVGTQLHEMPADISAKSSSQSLKV